MATTKTITIDASGSGSAGINFNTFIADYIQGLNGASYAFYGGEPAGANGEQLVLQYKNAGIDTAQRIMIEGDIAYDYIYHNMTNPPVHAFSGRIDALTFGDWVSGTSGSPGTGASGKLQGLAEFLKITGLDLEAAPGTGSTNAIHSFYKLFNTSGTVNTTAVYDLLSEYAQNFIGSDGNDTYAGTEHDDTIDGGAGVDTVVYTGASTNYTITDTGGGVWTVTDNRTGAENDGTDTLTDVELLQFTDGTVALGEEEDAAPVAGDDSASTVKDLKKVIDVLANDTDADGTLDPASVTIVDGPAHGTLTINTTTGAITYTPTTGYVGADSFTYTVKDNDGNVSNVASVTLDVTGAHILTDGDDVFSGDSLGLRFSGIEVHGGAGDDYIVTSNSASHPDVIYGGAGNDLIFTGGGDDYVEGGAGDDVIHARAGNDTVKGGAGDDTYVVRFTDAGVTTIIDNDGTLFHGTFRPATYPASWSPAPGATSGYGIAGEATQVDEGEWNLAVTDSTGATVNLTLSWTGGDLTMVRDGSPQTMVIKDYVNGTFGITLEGVVEENTPPVINSNGGGATATIEVAENTTAVTTVAASDADAGDTITYSISGGDDASLFQINTTTGALSFKTAPDFEHPTDSGANNVYDVVVRATDTGGLFDDQSIAITVTDVNELPTNLALSKSSVDEDAATGTVVGELSATDPEGQPLSYTLTNDAGGKFKVAQDTDGKWKLFVNGALDYETATSHQVEVKVSDGVNEVKKTFTVNVGDVADTTDTSRGTITLDASGSNGIDYDAFLKGGFLTGTTSTGFPSFDNGSGFSGTEAYFNYGTVATSKYITARGSFGYDMSTHRIAGKIDTIEYGTRGTGSFNGSGSFTGGNTLLRITGLDLANDANADSATGEVHNFTSAHMYGSSGDATRLALYLQHLKQYAQNVIGSNGADTYIGTRFNDTVKGNGGNDTIDGGLGEDTFVLNGNKADYTWVENKDGTWTVTDKRTGSNDGVDTIKGIEKLKFADETVTIGAPEVSDIIEGTAGNDFLPGTSRSDRILGHEGNDQLYGKGGHDVLNGGAGNDILYGGTGNDQLYGGEGRDVLYGGTGNDEAYGGAGNDQLYGGVGKDVLYGGAGRDVLYGGTGNDELYGGAGNDELNGGTGKDILAGGAGNDTLRGGDGNDEISGGAGNDRIVGGKGADLLSGGSGKDMFVFNTLTDSTLKTSDRDTILDFNGKAGDRIDLSGIDANTGASGNQSFSFIGSDKFSGKAGELRFEKTASDTFVYGDVDGDGTADFAILVAGNTTLLKDYFVL